ncbi:hypothetical protein NM688_g6313 [Phlebia brevispora]|uniref:Uncharacterized protein n=1 Tax=Phlebia brevispora TaxID=194682 RepID=A0ACC1SHB3_9APHY|nr:hypothetical protein NM688_g6313 [Phlebia brevispora]
MRFTSAENPDVRSGEELVVLCYEEQRILLPLPPTFGDAIRVARENFDISIQDDVLFETTDLAGCTELGAVQIREAAWPGISPILSKIFVRTTKRRDVVAEINRLSQRLSLTGKPDPIPKSHRLFDSLSGAPPTAQSSSTAFSRRSFGTGALVPSTSATLQGSSRPSLEERIAALPDPRESLRQQSSGKHSSSGARLSTESAKVSEKDELEEEEEFFTNPSPSKGMRSTRQRIMSDDEEEEEYDRVHKDEAHSAEDEEEEAAVESAVAPGPSSQGSDAPAASATVKQEKTDAITTKIERLSISNKAPAKSKPVDLHSLIGPLDSMEKTFLISVDFDEGEGDGPRTSTFKTKGRHTVHKVLYTVCRTFGLEEYYQQAQLVLVVEEEVGTDEIIEHRFMCDRNDTMERAGARPDSRFLLLLNEEEES